MTILPSLLPRELLLRVGAILGRAYPAQGREGRIAGATVDMAKAEAWRTARNGPARQGNALFEKLYQNAGRIVTTGILCETICGEFWQGYESTLSTPYPAPAGEDRRKPIEAGFPDYHQGLGYRLNLREVSP